MSPWCQKTTENDSKLIKINKVPKSPNRVGIPSWKRKFFTELNKKQDHIKKMIVKYGCHWNIKFGVQFLPQFAAFRLLWGDSWWGPICFLRRQSSSVSSLSTVVLCFLPESAVNPAVTIFLSFWILDPVLVIYNILLILVTRFPLLVHLGKDLKSETTFESTR